MQDKISADPRWKHQQIAPGVSRVPYDPDLPIGGADPKGNFGYVAPLTQPRRAIELARRLHENWKASS